MAFATCVIIAGSLWMTGDPGSDMIQAVRISKEPAYETVQVWDGANFQYQYDVHQHQLRMGTEEFLSDCIAMGYTMPVPQAEPYDDIDDEETTGVGE